MKIISRLLLTQVKKQAAVGFEPTYNGFANRCLATWLPRRFGHYDGARLLAHASASTKDLLILPMWDRPNDQTKTAEISRDPNPCQLRLRRN